MIRINQIKLSINHSEDELLSKIKKILKVNNNNIEKYKIYKKSIDAREKSNIIYVYSVDVYLKNEKEINKRVFNKNVFIAKKDEYTFKPTGVKKLNNRPIIIGMGPAGLFCGYMLAKEGYRPILLERGKMVNERTKDVEEFFETGVLNTTSNVQFGEGGAGTFSDGKLATMVKDKNGRNHEVLRIFNKFGAKDEILYINKPHIGTDILAKVVENIRNEIIRLGGEVRFESQVTDFVIQNNEIKGVNVFDLKENKEYIIDAEVVVLAIGHSARDTFEKLYDRGFDMNAKNFAVGVRFEHPQEMIDISNFGKKHNELGLPASDYKLTGHAKNGRNVFSFCMCPGGYVVNASSEEGMLAVNGMSYSRRDGKNANSAIIVSVTTDDYEGSGPLAGIEFQRKLEKAAYDAGKGNIPVQLFGDFENNIKTTQLLDVTPSIKGKYQLSNLRNIFSDEINEALIECIHDFGKKIAGYDRKDAVMSGVESRTSSPVRIERNDEFVSNIAGVYPCGEGAGYAGGITSAAMDGIKVYEAIATKYSI